MMLVIVMVATLAQDVGIARPRVGGIPVGERQTREDVPTIEPMARIESRVPNRVQSRIRSRIDRYYDPQANATAPFVVAGDQARSTRRTGVR